MAVPKRRTSRVRSRRRRAVNMRIQKPVLVKDKSGKGLIRPHYTNPAELKKE
jgi:ribosomal protein L32